LGTIRLTNNTKDTINNVNAEITFSGKSFSKFSVITEKGFYQSANDKIVWNQNTFDNLKSLD
jgi:hypothetical protein